MKDYADSTDSDSHRHWNTGPRSLLIGNSVESHRENSGGAFIRTTAADGMSVNGGISLWRILFRIHPESIKPPQVVDSFKLLHRQIRKPLRVKEARQLSHHATATLGKMRRRPRIIRACFVQAFL